MTPLRTMTGDTFTDEKTPQSPVSPTGTDTTLRGDAYIEVADENSDCHPTVLAPMPTTSNDVDVDIESAQPCRSLHATILAPSAKHRRCSASAEAQWLKPVSQLVCMT